MIRRFLRYLRHQSRLLPIRIRKRIEDRRKWRRLGNRVPRDVVERVKEHKAATAKLRSTYVHDPKLGVVVTSFNQLWNVPTLADRLLANPHVSEVIVSDDGSIDGSLEAWVSRLVGPNHFLVRSNDLHEIRSLDRAVRLCRADIVCVIQDDDVVPGDDWAAQALDLFNRHPRLAVLGGFMAFTDAPGYDPPAVGPSLLFTGTATTDSADFRFVPTVSIGPYYVRAAYYAECGGFDINFSDPGQAGVGFDEEFALRAWLNDWQVGYLHQAFKTGVPGEYDYGAGGTFLYGAETERTTHDRENKARIAEIYAPHHDHIMDLVRTSNEQLFTS
jgi:glycosyltransferase involved in cell wall biosynthesis